jgi:hypothetical protein
MAEASNPQVSPDIPFEVDGETIYLSPNSAEGKALQRVEAMEAGEQVEWITVFDPEIDTLDEAALEAWLTERGYPVVQSPDPSASQH